MSWKTIEGKCCFPARAYPSSPPRVTERWSPPWGRARSPRWCPQGVPHPSTMVRELWAEILDEVVFWSWQDANLLFWTMIPLSNRFANLIESDEVFFLHRLTGQVWPNTRHVHPAAVGGLGQDTGDFSGWHCQLGRCVGSTVPPKQKGVSNSISLNFATIHQSVYQTFG